MCENSEKLLKIWKSFDSEANAIWDELGLDHSIRETHLVEVLSQINQTFQDRIRQERNVRDQTRRNIGVCASKIDTVCKQLGLPDSESKDFVSQYTSPEISLVQSHDALTRHLEKLMRMRDEAVQEMIGLLTTLFAMEAEFGESMGSLELISEIQEWTFSESQANTFKNNPQQLDADRLVEIPATCEKLLLKKHELKRFHDERTQEVSTLLQNIQNYCLELGEDLVTHAPKGLNTFAALSKKRIDLLLQTETQLLALRARREANIHELANKLKEAWELLKTPEEYWRAFIAKNTGRSLAVIHACEQELDRLNAEKQDRMKELVLDLRKTIHDHWNTLDVPFHDREIWEADYDYEQPVSEATLYKHQTMAASLAFKVKTAAPILTLIQEHQTLVEQKAQLEEITRDGSRLLDPKYGSKGLKQEERLRNRVETLPKVVNALIKQLQNWKLQNNGEAFLYGGVDFLKLLLDEQKAAAEAKARKDSEKKMGRTFTGASLQTPRKTPVPASSTATTSSSSTTTTTPAPRPTVSQTPSANRHVSRTLSAEVQAPSTTGRATNARSRTKSVTNTAAKFRDENVDKQAN